MPLPLKSFDTFILCKSPKEANYEQDINATRDSKAKTLQRAISYLREVQAPRARDSSLRRISTRVLEGPKQNHQVQHPMAREKVDRIIDGVEIS